MSDSELELTQHARELEDANGEVNPFLAHEHELLMKAAQRLGQLSAGVPARG
jgi:hypothetical protein